MTNAPDSGGEQPARPLARLSAHVPWVLPFAVFMVLLAVMPKLGLAPAVDQAVRLVLVGGVVLAVSRPVLDLRVRSGIASVGIGVAVFLIWIGPDLLIPGWRESVLFSNDIVGRPESGFPEAGRTDPLAIVLRFIRAAVLVPVIEELFWRGWLPRVAIDPAFERIPLGTYTPFVFWITALLFASEHGSWWEVGLVAGVIYNWWMMRTRSLGDCILAHAVTNAGLSTYVLLSGKWQYW
ncbi:MAG TPA: CAAX prenyl protease-related protein [Gemmatimonadales bacterium]|nr:CAAX prenyl protease-related protein [Gemmatimonadales bacterium]